MLLVIALLARCVTSTTIIDLSQDWVIATDANAEAALDAVVEEDILAYSLVHGGKIIAEYYRDGRDASDTAAIWSVTKSWTSLLIGTLVKDGLLTRQTTLGDIFVELDWSDIEDGDAKKTITIEDLLQMESGYAEDGGYLGHVFGGLEGALDFGKYDESETGSFHYVNHHILSYVVLELTGSTPLEYASEKVFPALGINPDEMSWSARFDGVEHAAFGMKQTPRQMLKLGQLMLQGGDDLVDAAWISSTFTDAPGNSGSEGGYGYRWWLPPPSRTGGATCWLALGADGQMVAVFPDLDAVIAIQSDEEEEDSSYAIGKIVPSVIADLTSTPRPTPGPTPSPGNPTAAPVVAPSPRPTPESTPRPTPSEASDPTLAPSAMESTDNAARASIASIVVVAFFVAAVCSDVLLM